MGLQFCFSSGVDLGLAARSVSDVDVSSVVVLGHPPVARVAEGVLSVDLSPGRTVLVVKNGNPRVFRVGGSVEPYGLVGTGFS